MASYNSFSSSSWSLAFSYSTAKDMAIACSISACSFEIFA